MRTSIIIIIASILLSAATQAQFVTKDYASAIANNFVSFIVNNKGDWGGSKTAQVVELKISPAMTDSLATSATSPQKASLSSLDCAGWLL